MRWIEIIHEDVDPEFDSLDALRVWANALGVTLDAAERAYPTGSRFAGNISIVWIERRKKARPGTGARVMRALCRYADQTHATIDLQADNEDVLPEYYGEFGFRVVPSDSGDDVAPTGPDMERRPKTRKARKPLGSTVVAPITQSEPIGVAALHCWGQDRPGYYIVFDPKRAKQAKVNCSNRINDVEDIWVGYVVNTIEWTAMKSKIGLRTEMVVPSQGTPDADDRARWNDLSTKGKVVFRVNHQGDC